MNVIQKTYNNFKIDLIMRLIAVLLVVFVSKPICVAINSLLDDSDKMSFLLVEKESSEEENSEEEVDEIDKIFQFYFDVNLKNELITLYSINNHFDSDFEYKITGPPPDFVL